MPFAYYSEKMNKAQSNYSVTEYACLAVVLALKKFRPYVEGQDFTIITDHASLQWLMKQLDLTGRLARWSLKLQGFRFNIEHRRESQNVVPDCLSRQNFEEVFELELNPLIDLESPHFDSEEYVKLRRTILENRPQLPDLSITNNKIYKRCEFSNGKLEDEMFNWKLWVPSSLVQEVIDNAHSQPNKCHGGVGKTIERLRRNLYWPHMA